MRCARRTGGARACVRLPLQHIHLQSSTPKPHSPPHAGPRVGAAPFMGRARVRRSRTLECRLLGPPPRRIECRTGSGGTVRSLAASDGGSACMGRCGALLLPSAFVPLAVPRCTPASSNPVARADRTSAAGHPNIFSVLMRASSRRHDTRQHAGCFCSCARSRVASSRNASASAFARAASASALARAASASLARAASASALTRAASLSASALTRAASASALARTASSSASSAASTSRRDAPAFAAAARARKRGARDKRARAGRVSICSRRAATAQVTVKRRIS